ncbi:DDE superfamily endonuclease domain-containing protein [Hirsutella rhossiliensis]|uniref:DDE superfamily endonuclease domain-containing protein n=1 Tax=Hirsutella rhossiliensis TaxID=111463 RepID=A0A9P8SJF2_9HYPO|nr:DDE superfamily endonuclease domain-containing protein [Hirsutella rhossiliensis]KAH0963650.1 DDE superfamily endonuclease domain-containing protein [Hirsutella rhossiliensis]
MDEAGIMEGLGENGLVVGSAEKRSVQKKTPGSRVWTSFIECVSAAGTFLPPLVIFKGKSVQQQWFPEDLSTFSDWQFTATKNGWTSDQTAVEWLEKVFIPRTQPPDPSERRLLVLDGHGSHETVDFMVAGKRRVCGRCRWRSHFEPSSAGEQQQTQKNAKNVANAFNSHLPTSDWQSDTSQIAWSTPRRSQDLKVQVVQFNQLDDDVPTKRLLFRKITKGFDEKDGLLAKAQLQIQALETQLAAVKPKKKEEGGHEPEFEVRQY